MNELYFTWMRIIFTQALNVCFIRNYEDINSCMRRC